MNRCPPGVDSSFFSIPVLPGQRRQRHDPSRSFPMDLRCQHGSTRFTQVGLPFPVLQGSPRLFLTCQKPPERPPVHPGPLGIIPVHHGGLRFNPRYSPVHPGPWTGVNRGVPGAQWDWGIKKLHSLHILYQLPCIQIVCLCCDNFLWMLTITKMLSFLKFLYDAD